jgi:hypothetical protein
MTGVDNLNAIKDSLLGTGNEKKTKPEFYISAGKEFVRILCENVYTSDNVNLKDRFNEILINAVSKALTQDTEISAKIRGIIIGDDSNPGLKQYVKELFIFSTKSDDDKIYSFTSRVLQSLFKKQDRTIPDVLTTALIDLKPNYNPNEVFNRMKEIIENRLGIIPPSSSVVKEGGSLLSSTINGVTRGLSNTLSSFSRNSKDPKKSNTSSIDNQTPINETSVGGISNNEATSNDKPDLLQQCSQLEQTDEYKQMVSHGKDSIQENTVEKVKEAHDDINAISEADQAQKLLIDVIASKYDSEPFTQAIRTNILKSLTKIFSRFKESIYEKITETIVNKYTNAFINEDTVKLQILYSILFYTPGSKSENGLRVAQDIFKSSMNDILKQIKQLQEGNNEVSDEQIRELCFNETSGVMFYLHNNLFDNMAAANTGSISVIFNDAIKSMTSKGGRKKTKRYSKTSNHNSKTIKWRKLIRK